MKFSFRTVLFALIALPCALAVAAPMGYSVNSDEPLGDSLFVVDLDSGAETEIGKVLSAGIERSDIEGLAFDPFGTLWAVDDESQNLFPINTNNALVMTESEVGISGLNDVRGNDFGLSFTCSGNLYITSVESQSLYSLGLDGTATLIGSEGSLGARISAIAAYGNPGKLYGLGNGLVAEGGPPDNRSLFDIDMDTGTATLVGPIGDQVADYFEAGLSFDEGGTLWAITDRRTSTENLGSQVLRVNTDTGEATVVSTTSVAGFESLAIAPPAGCEPLVDDDNLHRIPVLGPHGMLLAVLTLLGTGLLALRRVSG